MKKRILSLITILSLILNGFLSFSQCEPMTPEECPDPENNGQVCPDSLELAFINQFYSQVATIKFPAVYYMPPDSTEINLHHVKLTEVGNLPDGMTWQSNTPDSVFIAGEYYCVLLEGTPDSAGEYPLRITADVYVLVFNIPIKVATVTDSTSLSILVVDDSGIRGGNFEPVSILQNSPNPFQSETCIKFNADNSETLEFEVYSAQGKRIHYQKFTADKGENSLFFNGRMLSPGMYFYLIKSGGYQATGKMIKSDH